MPIVGERVLLIGAEIVLQLPHCFQLGLAGTLLPAPANAVQLMLPYGEGVVQQHEPKIWLIL